MAPYITAYIVPYISSPYILPRYYLIYASYMVSYTTPIWHPSEPYMDSCLSLHIFPLTTLYQAPKRPYDIAGYNTALYSYPHIIYKIVSFNMVPYNLVELTSKMNNLMNLMVPQYPVLIWSCRISKMMKCILDFTPNIIQYSISVYLEY